MSASDLPANDLRRVALCWDANDGAVELLSWPADRGVALTWPRRALAADSRFHALTLPGRLRHLRRAVELARSEGIGGAVSAWPYNKPPPSSTDTNPVGGDSSDPSDRFSGLAPTRQKQAGYRGIRGTSVTSVTECFPPLNALAQPDLEGTSNVQSL